MSDYLITGKKGNGKTIYAVEVIRRALREGRRVATNIDLRVEKLRPPSCRGVVYRIPDSPTVDDLVALGRGQEGVVEDDNGLIVLDETTKILNARSWQGKDRNAVLDWLVHSRKLGWDVYMIAQGQAQLDKQLREALLEYWVVVKRMDKWPIPLLSPVLRLLFEIELTFPRMSMATIRHGFDRNALVIRRDFYRGQDLWGAYDTQQVFLSPDHPAYCGPYSMLSAWHLVGRYRPARRSFREWLEWQWDKPAAVRCPASSLAPKRPIVALLMSLPVEQRERHWRRFNDLGAI